MKVMDMVGTSKGQWDVNNKIILLSYVLIFIVTNFCLFFGYLDYEDQTL